MNLYCLKCKTWTYPNHKCSPLTLVPITPDCLGIANRLYSLGIELLSASCHTCALDSFRHIIDIQIELKKEMPLTILGDIPTGWQFFAETASSDHIPLPFLVLAYIDNFEWTGELTVKERTNQIIQALEQHLDTRDPHATKAILTLMYS